MSRPLRAVLLAAGRGTRMNSDRPKVLHEIFGRPLLDYPLVSLRQLGVKRPVVVVGWGKEEVLSHLPHGVVDSVTQTPQLGTGHAVQAARRKVGGFRGDLLVWPADMILLQKETLSRLLRGHRESGAAVTVLSSFRVDPTGYGRVLRRGGRVIGIREELDADEAEKRIHEVNTGVYVFEPRALFRALEKIRPKNRKKEYYLTDTVRLIDEAGGRVEALPYAPPEEAQGINSQADLASATRILSQKNILNHQRQGVTIVSPEQTFIAPEVSIGRDTVIYPWTFIERGVRIGRKCRIGPFARIRSGSVIEDGAVIGSFVEVVRSRIGKKVLAKHLTYLGDATVGAGTNIGAGTITANYDGLQVGDKAKTGAGAVLTRGTKIGKGRVFVGVPARPLNRDRSRGSRKS
ncbi:MAG: bifunctional N-acetylglucosamine-1-phosphate uridyltransferase/glucosamine-1-phosphate acetyltransferase [Candidatus Omnitrophica bacterium]|nr:bifunctional N-acetylglucosamine-1-phosphate uridyltransferase/glucosamine-1-phosphate acetyltransferase [Candidatus Omnitrophota bacterium]